MSKKKVSEHTGAGKGKKQQKRKLLRTMPSQVDQPVSQTARSAGVDMPQSALPQSVISGISAARFRQVRPQRHEIVTDYRYVVSDLKRIGVIAAVMFVIIIALSFVIR
ncbi:MAG: hypothetical protein HYY30_03995 [Chloroflexi bacterium]|nr:hypothetical protein [Chloroflexota bacterium]